MSRKSGESVVSHMLLIRDKLMKMKELADNLLKAQEQQKIWHDKNSSEREFQCNEMVLLLLPTSTNKLLAKWQGPYKVAKQVGKVDYLIETPDQRQKKGIYQL